MSKTLQEVALEAVRCFETAERPQLDDQGQPVTFVRIEAGSPEWVTDLARAAHGVDTDGAPALLPDDWRYKTTAEALEFLAELSEYANPDEEADTFAEQAVDVYTFDRIAWLGSNLRRVEYVDAAVEEYGIESRGIVDDIAVGQHAEAREVYELVVEFLQERVEEHDAAECFGDPS
jgi:hypothetical protein